VLSIKVLKRVSCSGKGLCESSEYEYRQNTFGGPYNIKTAMVHGRHAGATDLT